ncbi:MAG: hypothetical protein QM817_26505 [Archangium sp.]
MKAMCLASHTNSDHVAAIDAWADRALLDEVDMPKKFLADCVADRRNEELASVFPAAAVRAVGKSWAEFVEQLSACPGFVAALEA